MPAPSSCPSAEAEPLPHGDARCRRAPRGSRSASSRERNPAASRAHRRAGPGPGGGGRGGQRRRRQRGTAMSRKKRKKGAGGREGRLVVTFDEERRR